MGIGFKFQIGMGMKSLELKEICMKTLLPRISRLRDTPMSYHVNIASFKGVTELLSRLTYDPGHQFIVITTSN